MDALVVTTCQQALLAVLVLSAPATVTAVLVGLIVSVLQTATQVQEQTIAYVPKLVAVSAALAISGPWMLSELIRLATSMFEHVAASM